MDLSALFSLVSIIPEYRHLVNGVGGGGEQKLVVPDAAMPFLLAALFSGLASPIVVITARPDEARQLEDQLKSWLGKAVVELFPEPDSLPYERLVSEASTVQQRLKILSILLSGYSVPIVVASAQAVAHKTLSPSTFAAASHTLKRGMKVNLEELLASWGAMGYKWESTVELPGTFSRRGGIIDVYSPSSDLPARIELVGDEVETMRLFDASTQRSVGLVNSLLIVPPHEVLFSGQEIDSGAVLSGLSFANCNAETLERFQNDTDLMVEGGWPVAPEYYAPLFNSGNLLDYLKPGTLLVLVQPAEIRKALGELDAISSEMRREQIARGEIPRNFPVPYLTWNELTGRIRCIERRLLVMPWQSEPSELSIPFVASPAYGGRLAAFVNDVKDMLRRKQRIIIVSHQARRLSELLLEENIIAPPLSRLDSLPPRGLVTLLEGSLAHGWGLDSSILFTDAELFGFTKKRRQVKRRPVRRAGFLSELTAGDYVVHVDHGIARFAGVKMMKAGESEREYLILEYAAGDRLYVPTDQVDRVSRYIGSGAGTPALSRLGSQEWARAKHRAKQAAEELVSELLSLYAAREVTPGFAFSPDTTWQEELEVSFQYVETPDQTRANQEIKADMERSKPMDRLVCGDVGYGKTELAVRAAFKAVMDGAQVAILVPTTVLAQQHFQTFNERLSAFPVRVEVLSRFRSEREQREVVEGLRKGVVDIVIGTHRLLQKDVSFKNLGLVVVDEEQRFGVVHKEHLKQMRKEVDVLTLTATPIPRTLHMALSGVRDLSTMETPPEDRLPIKTRVAEYDERLVREAILREIDRGGQVFFVHNRVNSIYRVASQLGELVPEAEISVAHGQMGEEQLESVMLAFAQGKVDILISTTIIESGLDIPNVNTLVVNDADKLGLSQLYQLRGRVGRGSSRAYAYFLYGKGKMLTPQARRRLETIFEAMELGAGFHIAMRDLEIRGAGNLLGAEQSGHIGAVGFELYSRLLQEAVQEVKGEPARVVPQAKLPSIDLPMSAFIPERYISDLDTRLTIYQRMARAISVGHVKDIVEELEDRFGPIPMQLENLLYALRLRILAADAGIESMAAENGYIVLRMLEGRKLDRALFEKDADVQVGTRQIRIDIKRLSSDWKHVLESVVRRLGSTRGSAG